ncbi:MAG: 50S ribosomal protein L22 [Synergistaceae bacterium]|nr:50S ribosomal protein L22 [Synergistaceae bacterium]MBQ9594594.1 50S ribosomal protein L22 [Synergistaceae bacterium]
MAEIKTATAMTRNARISPYKLRQVLELIRGKSAAKAVVILKFSNKRAAGIILKVLNSAMANAEHNYGMDLDKLYVHEAFANQGPMMKRFRPVSMGRAHPYVHKLSHVTITLGERQ